MLARSDSFTALSIDISRRYFSEAVHFRGGAFQAPFLEAAPSLRVVSPHHLLQFVDRVEMLKDVSETDRNKNAVRRL